MRVLIETHTASPLITIYKAARTCYAAERDDITRDVSEEKMKKFVNGVIKSGHTSVAEHVWYTFYVDGVSRNLTHQLVRHKVGTAFSQKSQRYTLSNDKDNVIIPETIDKNPWAFRIFKAASDAAFDAYDKLIEMGIPKEDARYIVPTASPTAITFSMNVRELLHFFKLRTCKRAQDEIREMCFKMIEVLRDTDMGWLFSDENIAPSCLFDKCKELHSCGSPYQKNNFAYQHFASH